MSKSNPNLPTINITGADPVTGYITSGISDSTPVTTAGYFATGCILENATNGFVYSNTGTPASPVWNSVSEVTTAEIADGAVTLAKLAAGVTPSHVVKYAGKITWSGSGASLATAVTGILSTDIVTVTIQTAPTQAAYIKSAAPTTDTLTVTLSAANTSNDAVIAYTVFRAVA